VYIISSIVLILFALGFIIYSTFILYKRNIYAIKYKNIFFGLGKESFWVKVIIVTYPIQILIGFIILYQEIFR